MADNTIIQQGRFTSTGVDVTLNIRSDFDYIETFNQNAATQANGDPGAADLAFKFEWQRGMTDGRGFVWTKRASVADNPLTVAQIAASSGFVLVDQSGNPLGGSVAITGSSDVVRPIVSTASTAGLSSGSIVRLSGMTGQLNMAPYDFAIDTVVTNTSFRIASALATAPGAAATAGFYRIVRFDPLFYPRWRYVVNITQATNAVVTVSVPSGYAVGQKVRVLVPTTSQAGVSDFGMTQINNMVGTVVAVNDAIATQTVTLNIDSSAFTAFTFPTAAKAATKALGRAMLVPAGMDTSYALSQSVDAFSDASDNQGQIGVRLVGGAAGPAGAASNVIYWKATKSFSVSNS